MTMPLTFKGDFFLLTIIDRILWTWFRRDEQEPCQNDLDPKHWN